MRRRVRIATATIVFVDSRARYSLVGFDVVVA